MQKNKNSKKEEMYLAIDIWKDSKVSQSKFCHREGISFHTFKYWYKKYKIENERSNNSQNLNDKIFIPVEVSSEPNETITKGGQIEVIFPNGIQLSCPVEMNIANLKNLLGI